MTHGIVYCTPVLPSPITSSIGQALPGFPFGSISTKRKQQWNCSGTSGAVSWFMARPAISCYFRRESLARGHFAGSLEAEEVASVLQRSVAYANHKWWRTGGRWAVPPLSSSPPLRRSLRFSCLIFCRRREIEFDSHVKFLGRIRPLYSLL